MNFQPYFDDLLLCHHERAKTFYFTLDHTISHYKCTEERMQSKTQFLELLYH